MLAAGRVLDIGLVAAISPHLQTQEQAAVKVHVMFALLGKGVGVVERAVEEDQVASTPNLDP